MECVLEVRDLWCAVTEGADHRALHDDAARVKKSRTAKYFLLLHISPKLREAAISLSTAKEVWESHSGIH
jgi:hypothetical protein